MGLNAEIRKNTGKGNARQNRNQGFIPAVVYGKNTSPIPLAVKTKEIEDYIKEHGSAKMLNLKVEGKERLVLLKDISREIISRKLLHVDFFEVAQDKEITVTVPITLDGTPKGINEGGILMSMNREIEVNCLPKDIPEGAIHIDISNMNINDTLHVSDIKLPQNLSLESDPDMPIASITLPREEPKAEEAEGEVEGEEAAAETKPEEAAAEPELVDQKGKKDKEE